MEEKEYQTPEAEVVEIVTENTITTGTGDNMGGGDLG